jgi:hypothetical protein
VALARQAFEQTVDETRRLLWMFDDEGRFWGLERPAVAQALARVLRQRDGEVRLVFHETGYFERHCVALHTLLRNFAPRLSVQRSEGALRSHSRGWVLSDDRVVLRRPQLGRNLAVIDYDDQAISQTQTLFQEILANTAPGVSARTTGL